MAMPSVVRNDLRHTVGDAFPRRGGSLPSRFIPGYMPDVPGDLSRPCSRGRPQIHPIRVRKDFETVSPRNRDKRDPSGIRDADGECRRRRHRNHDGGTYHCGLLSIGVQI